MSFVTFLSPYMKLQECSQCSCGKILETLLIFIARKLTTGLVIRYISLNITQITSSSLDPISSWRLQPNAVSGFVTLVLLFASLCIVLSVRSTENIFAWTRTQVRFFGVLGLVSVIFFSIQMPLILTPFSYCS